MASTCAGRLKRAKVFPGTGISFFAAGTSTPIARRFRNSLNGIPPGWVANHTQRTANGTFTSDSGLVFTDDFPPAAPDGVAELDLSGRGYLRYDLDAANLAYSVQLQIFFRKDGQIPIRALREGMIVAEGQVAGLAGSLQTVDLAADAIDSVELDPSLAALVDLSFLRVEDNIARNWEKVPGILYPLALPLTHPDYPPSAGAAENLAAARQFIKRRILYGDPNHFFPTPYVVTGQGTVGAAPGFAIVTGQATGWDDSLTGELLQIQGDPTAYLVLAVLSPEKLVLSRPYGGPGGNALSYTINHDPFGQLHDALVSLVRGGPLSQDMASRFLPAPVESRGSVAVKRAANTVQGAGTAWTADLAGLYMRLAGDSLDYRVVSVNPGAQELTIDPPYVGADASGLPYAIAARLGPADESGSHLAEQSLLEMAQIAALHPAAAQLLGLYAVDTQPMAGVAYDYLVLGAGKPLTVGPPTADPGQDALDWIGQNGLDDPLVDAAVIFNRQIGPAAPLAKPSGLASYALPTSGFTEGTARATEAGAVGLAWELGETGGQALLPGRPILYHVWRADLGAAEPTAPPTATYTLLTRGSPLLVLHSDPPGSAVPKRKDWPPLRLHYIDAGLAEGWYDYRVTGIDLFGRYSPDSDPAPWQEWTPAPDPRPWYWGGPTAPLVNAYAVGLLDKTPPPAPTGVEAFALDPEDPYLVRDQVYLNWWIALTASPWFQNLPQADRKKLIGLRVRWLWTEGQQSFAPDTAEFRIYYQPGPWNAVFGRVTRVTPVANQTGQSLVDTNITHTHGAGYYVGASLRIGADVFPVLISSGPGSPLSLTVGSGPVISAGQASVKEGSPVVTGKNSAWDVTHNGLTLRIAGESRTYRVLMVNPSNQTLTLDASYHGTSGDKTYSLSGRLPRVGQPCSVVFSAGTSGVPLTDYYASTAWEQRVDAVRYVDHVSTILIPVRDRNGIVLGGQQAAVSGVEITLQDLDPGADLSSLDPESKLNTLLLGLEKDAVPGRLYPVISVDPVNKNVRLPAAPSLTATPSPWMLCYQARRYEVFLPDPTHAQPAGINLPVTRGEPVAYGSVGVSAADDKPHTPDTRQGLPWGDRPGNEGQVSPPATVFRVLRDSPDAPEIPTFAADRLFATRADYHGQSYYTVRWMPAAGLRAHLFRALDEALYQTDWLIRSTRASLDLANSRHADCFPASMSLAQQQAAAQQLNGLASRAAYAGLSTDAREILRRLPGNAGYRDESQRFDRDWEIRRSRRALAHGDPYLPPEWTPNPDTPAAQAKRQDAINRITAIASTDDYVSLTDDARRVLASLPGSELAFAQVTVESLDPDEADPQNPAAPRWANHRGPDDPDSFVVDPALRAFLDHLDGRASNAFFYRVAVVDSANNTSPLSLSTPPIYCPDVVPPRAPVITKILAGNPDPNQDQNCKITIQWASNREPDLAEYRIYRADKQEDARDLRLMMQVHAQVETRTPPNRPASLTWVDDPVPGLRTFFYCITAIDSSGNVSEPSMKVPMRAFDVQLPTPPALTAGWVDTGGGVFQAELSWNSPHEVSPQRRRSGSILWSDVAGWLAPSNYTLIDAEAETSSSYEYRLRVRKYTGAVVIGADVTLNAKP